MVQFHLHTLMCNEITNLSKYQLGNLIMAQVPVPETTK